MLSVFLEQLFDSGRVVVPRPEPESEVGFNEATDVLLESESIWRLQQPDGVPQFDLETGLWAALTVYRSAQLLVYRDLGEDSVTSLLKPRFASASLSASEHYSADLCLRFMKDILRLNQSASSNDLLNTQIRSLTKDWPLSWVGLGEPVSEVSVVWTHSALRLMYLDRLFQQNRPDTKQGLHVTEELRKWAPMMSSPERQDA